nr:hypothetical protein [Tanacetum cinerariifolium]
MKAGSKDRPPMLAPEKEVPISEGSPIIRTEKFQETYKNVSQDIRDQLNAEAEVDGESLESYYSRFYKMMNELIRNQCDVTNHQVNVQFLLQLQPEWQRFVTLVKLSQELKTISYHKLYDILKQHHNEVNEIRAERIARVANPLALVAQQKSVYNPQTHPTHYTQNSSTRSQQTATRNRGKAVVNSPQPIYDQEPSMVAEDDETSKDKEIDKLIALISLSFKKIYKPTNNNLRTSSNTSRANQDNSLRINRGVGYENQRFGNVAGARETVGSTMVQKYRIQCYNCKEFGHVARECQKPKRAKDTTYQREKMLLCKQEEAGIQLNAKQADWRDETNDDELKDQKLEAHYMYMAQLQEKEAQIKLYKTREDKELDKVITLENKVKVLDNIVYKTGKSVQTMNMLNNKCRRSFAKPEFLKKAQRANPCLYDIGCYNENLVLMLAPESDEVIRLEKESRSKLSDLVRPFDYDKLNNLYDLFVPQREKSSEQRYFSKRSRLSHTSVNNGNSKESFNIQTTLLEKRMDESIPINAGLEQFHKCLNKETVADLRYFNSFKLEVDSLRSQLESPKTQFLNEIDRLSREYYYADHMNAILDVYTELYEVTNPQCDYLELLEKCECLEIELSKSKKMSKSFEALQKHTINLEIDLQQCQEKIKNNNSFTENLSKEFLKEREQYFEIQDLKTQLQDKGIVINELKKLIEKLKGKSMDTKFEKPSVIRQPNAFKSQRPSVLGKPTTFSNSLERKDFSKSKSVTQNNVSNDFSKPVTAQTLPPNKKSILKNTNVLGVIPTSSVSRPQLKSNSMGDSVMHKNSQGKKQDVKDHRKSVKFSKNKTSVTARNESLNAKTLNVNVVSATCDECVLNDKHDMCVLNSVAKPLKKTVASELNQKPINITRKLYERVSKACSWWYSKFTPSGYKWKPKSGKENVNLNVSMPLGNASRTANVMDPMTSRRSTVSNTPLSSNSFAARRDCPIHRRLWVLKAHDEKSQAFN